MTKQQEELLKLEQLRDEALSLMQKAGFPLDEPVSVELDSELPYMGYTTERDGKPVIVVAGFALKDNMALNLLIHEMSHVYRTQKNHPSHNQQLLLSIASWVMKRDVVENYQEQIVQAILNSIQDVYADDISFEIFEKHERLNEFFMTWIRKPVPGKTVKNKWENAEKLVAAAFAQGNLERHNIQDTGEKVAQAIKELLTSCDEQGKKSFVFFKEFFVHMPDEVTEKEFEKMLILYLSEFLKLTK